MSKPALRSLIRRLLGELVSTKKVDDDTWNVTPRGTPDYPGIDVKRYVKSLRTSKVPVYAAAIVRKRFEKDTVDDRRAPPDGKPVDVVKVVKKDAPYTNDDGITYVPIMGLQENVAKRAAHALLPSLKGLNIDVVSTIESKSELANSFGVELSKELGASFVPRGILKGVPTLDTPSDMEEKGRASLQRSFDRNVERGFQMKSVPPQFRNRVKMNMNVGDDLTDKATDPTRKERPRVLLVDDVVTSGSTLDGAAEALDGAMMDVVACAVVFKMED